MLVRRVEHDDLAVTGGSLGAREVPRVTQPKVIRERFFCPGLSQNAQRVDSFDLAGKLVEHATSLFGASAEERAALVD